MGDRTGSFLGCARVRTKCGQKTLVGLWGTIYDPRELPRVSTAGPGVDGVLQGICSADVASDNSVDATATDVMGVSSYGAVTNALGICSMVDTSTSITRSGKLSIN
jgi:hypothetical protein